MDMIAQGYPLFAAILFELEDAPLVCAVVGWSPLNADELVPVVVAFGGAGDFDGRANIVNAGKDEIRYLGPDRSSAVAACRSDAPDDAARATQSASHGRPAVRYAMGAVALCGLLNAHEPHTWVPDDHDFPISCTGGTP